MNVLLTSVGRRSYLVEYFKEAIGNTGKVHVSNSTALTPAFSVADKAVVTPLIYDERYIPFLASYCKENSIDAIISLFDIDLPILSQNKKMFEGIGVQVIVSDESVISICNDKFKTYNFLIQNGFNSPKTYIYLENVFEAIKNNEIKYPLIIKPRWGMGSIGIFEAENEEELKILFKKSVKSIKNSYLKHESNHNLNESVIIQEKLNGQEYGLDVINDLNKVYKNTIVKIKHAMRSGETDCSETVNNVELKKLGNEISDKLGHIANLDVDVFLVDNIPYVLEMNARFGGGYPFSHMAGVNLPEAIIKWVEKKEVQEELLQESVGILAHKDINMIILNPSNKINNNLVIELLKNEDEILCLLNEFDNIFYPAISEKVDILENYANKLSLNAFVYLVKTNKYLGFVTLYANDYTNKTAYISFIGVKKEARNMKIGKKLLKLCYKKAKEQEMKFIKLEVQNWNLNAIKFYENNGFSYVDEASSESVYLIKEI